MSSIWFLALVSVLGATGSPAPVVDPSPTAPSKAAARPGASENPILRFRDPRDPGPAPKPGVLQLFQNGQPWREVPLDEIFGGGPPGSRALVDILAKVGLKRAEKVTVIGDRKSIRQMDWASVTDPHGVPGLTKDGTFANLTGPSGGEKHKTWIEHIVLVDLAGVDVDRAMDAGSPGEGLAEPQGPPPTVPVLSGQNEVGAISIEKAKAAETIEGTRRGRPWKFADFSALLREAKVPDTAKITLHGGTGGTQSLVLARSTEGVDSPDDYLSFVNRRGFLCLRRREVRPGDHPELPPSGRVAVGTEFRPLIKITIEK